MRELIEAALIQSANDAAVALAQYVGHGSVAGLRRDDEREGAAARTHRHPLRQPGRARRRPATTRARATSRGSPQIVMHDPFVRSIVRMRVARITGRTLHTWNDLLATFPGLIGVKTGHTDERRLVRGGGGAGPRRDGLRDAARRAEPLGRGTTTWRSCSPGASRSTASSPSSRPAASTRPRSVPWGKRPLALVAATGDRARRPARPAADGARRDADGRLAPGRARDSGSARCASTTAASSSRVRRSSPTARSLGQASLGRVGWYAERTLDHIWSWFS